MLTNFCRALIRRLAMRGATAPRRTLCKRLESLESRYLLAPVSFPSAAVANAVHDVQTITVAPPLPEPIVNGTRTSEFLSVGIVNGGCSGTLISPRHVLTAAHCTDDVEEGAGTFELGTTEIGTIEQVEHPSYNFFGLANDIAVMVLAAPIDDVEPSDILRHPPSVGETLTLVGFGAGGTTFNEPFPHDFGTKRFGQTELESITNTLIEWRFDGDGEANTAPGDSGGPAFVQREGELLIAGVTSGGDGNAWNFGGVDQSFDTRVDAYHVWIDGVVNAEIPEPLPDDHADSPALGASKVFVVDGLGWAGGAIQQIGDRDAFQFTIVTSREVTITAVGIDGQLDTVLRLYRSNGSLITRNDDVDPPVRNSQIHRILTAGTYFFTIGGFEDRGVGPFAATLSTQSMSNSDRHTGAPGNAATDLVFSADGLSAMSDTLESDGDRDVFEFDVETQGPVVLSASATENALDAFLRLYDKDGSLIATNDDIPTSDVSDSLIERELDPGKYFVSVASFGGFSSGDYVLFVRRPTVMADFFVEPVDVMLDERGNAVFAGGIESVASFTTQRVVAPFRGTMTATSRVANSQADVRLAVYNSAGELLAMQNDRGLTNVDSTITFEVRENDEFIVVVAGEGFTTGDFWVTLRSLPQDRDRFPAAIEASRRNENDGIPDSDKSDTLPLPHDSINNRNQFDSRVAEAMTIARSAARQMRSFSERSA